MNAEISKVVEEMREHAEFHATRMADLSPAKVFEWADRIEAALQQPASADVDQEADELDSVGNIQAFARAYKAEIPNATLTVHGIAAGLRAITAALRKPRQEAEPVATVVAVRTNGTFVEQPVLEWHKTPKQNDKLYTTPQPATCNGAIDLGQFREAVECWKDHLRRAWKHSYSQGHPDATAADRLPALIDAQEKGA